MAVEGTRVIRFTADNDEFDSGQKRLKIAGVRLVAGAAAAGTASVREGGSTGQILYSMAAVQGTVDESQLPVPVDSGKLWVDLAGTGAEVFVYLE